MACQANTPETHNEPLKMSELPDTVWQDVSADFYGPLPTGEHLLVIVDEYSRYPVVEVMHSTSANSVIPVMDKIFSMLSIPRTVKTDNGPPFNGEQFSKFAAYMGFYHRKITPLLPQANATAERFMRTLGKCLRVSHMENIPWKQHLYTFLREYRATPHSTTTTSPAELLLKRRMHTKMPSMSTPIRPDEDLRRRDRKAKAKMKAYSDTCHHAAPYPLRPGDMVLCSQPRHNKLTTAYNPKPYRVTTVKGSMVTAERTGQSDKKLLLLQEAQPWPARHICNRSRGWRSHR